MSLLEDNLRAISDLELRRRLLAARPSPLVTFHEARSGDRVPVVLRDDATRWLHSRHDPRTEALRAAETAPQLSYLVVYGVGGGYHIEALREKRPAARILVVEPDIGFLRALIENRDLGPVLRDPRLQLVVGAGDQEVYASVAADYVPLVDGPHGDMSWPGERALPGLALLRSTVQAVLDQARRQIPTLAAFADLWARNLVRNALCRPRRPPEPVLRRVREAVEGSSVLVAAAGPSLEGAVFPRGTCVIATDTAYPSLAGRGVEPVVVVNLDPQAISTYHLRRGGARLSPLLASVTASPSYLRHFQTVVLMDDGHPLARRLFDGGDGHGELPSAFGTAVTQASVVVAYGLGAKGVSLVGADFSYPGAVPYARGTYAHDYFMLRSSRALPADSSAVCFVFRRARLEDGNYRSVLLDGYRLETEALLRNGPGRPLPRLVTPPGPERGRRRLQDLLHELREPVPEDSTLRAFLSESSSGRQAYLVLLPHLAMRVRDRDGPATAGDLEWARRRFCSLVQRYVADRSGSGLEDS